MDKITSINEGGPFFVSFVLGDPISSDFRFSHWDRPSRQQKGCPRPFKGYSVFLMRWSHSCGTCSFFDNSIVHQVWRGFCSGPTLRVCYWYRYIGDHGNNRASVRQSMVASVNGRFFQFTKRKCII